jgi:hypothetical protein
MGGASQRASRNVRSVLYVASLISARLHYVADRDSQGNHTDCSEDAHSGTGPHGVAAVLSKPRIINPAAGMADANKAVTSQIASVRPSSVHIRPKSSDDANRAAATAVCADAMALVRTEIAVTVLAIAANTPSVAA